MLFCVECSVIFYRVLSIAFLLIRERRGTRLITAVASHMPREVRFFFLVFYFCVPNRVCYSLLLLGSENSTIKLVGVILCFILDPSNISLFC